MADEGIETKVRLRRGARLVHRFCAARTSCHAPPYVQWEQALTLKTLEMGGPSLTSRCLKIRCDRVHALAVQIKAEAEMAREAELEAIRLRTAPAAWVGSNAGGSDALREGRSGARVCGGGRGEGMACVSELATLGIATAIYEEVVAEVEAVEGDEEVGEHSSFLKSKGLAIGQARLAPLSFTPLGSDPGDPAHLAHALAHFQVLLQVQPYMWNASSSYTGWN